MLYTIWQTTDLVRETAAAVQKDINKTNLWFVTTSQVSSRLTDGRTDLVRDKLLLF